MEKAADRTNVKCSFCQKHHPEIKYLFRGRGRSTICETCVNISHETLSVISSDFFGSLLGGKAKDGKKPPKILTPREIIKHLDMLVIEQSQPKEDLAVALYEHMFRKQMVSVVGKRDDLLAKSNILLFGPTGSGKTLLSKAMADLTDLPFYCGDATRITQAGYYGDDAESILKRLLQQCNYDLDKAQWGIVFLDEFDKLARKTGKQSAQQRDVNGEGAQRALLKILDGSEVPITIENKDGKKEILFDTSNLMFICAGSFDGLSDILQTRKINSSRIGFGGISKSKTEDIRETLYDMVTAEDLKEFGIIEEMVGRLHVFTHTSELKIQELERVLVEPRDSLIKQFTQFFEWHLISLEFTPEAITAMAKQAKDKKVGARGLRTMIKSILRPYISSLLPGNTRPGRLIIDVESVITPGHAKPQWKRLPKKEDESDHDA